MQEVTPQSIVQFFNAEASRLEAEAARLETEAKNFRKLASETERRFPLPVAVEQTPSFPNLDDTFDTLQKHLSIRRGRAVHVARRLNLSEKIVRDLVSMPASKYKIAARGWIVPKDGGIT